SSKSLQVSSNRGHEHLNQLCLLLPYWDGTTFQHRPVGHHKLRRPRPTLTAPDQQHNMEQRPGDGNTSNGPSLAPGKDGANMPPPKTVVGRALGNDLHSDAHKALQAPKAESEPHCLTLRFLPHLRPHKSTTLDIPGLTKSKVSPDGRIAQRDVGAKLVIVMVGLPARGKSYITKKLARYLNWLQHDTEIFNVGQLAAGKSPTPAPTKLDRIPEHSLSPPNVHKDLVDSVRRLISENRSTVVPSIDASPGQLAVDVEATKEASPEPMDQSASFFDPQNQRAVKMREQVALDTLDELLEYILVQGGSVGILDATNSTMERRKAIVDHIRKRAGPELNILFLESSCVDQTLLEANMRLKLSGPDYKGQDPVSALADFKKRVALYENSYVPLGEYEEQHDMAYIQMIDSLHTKLTASSLPRSSTYLLNFNLSPRQIWITRHGESLDDRAGRIGGDSSLSDNGRRYAKALANFIDHQRRKWEAHQAEKDIINNFPPRPGDTTPPNPSWRPRDRPRNFCVWSSMMQRSVQTVEYFNEEQYDIKQMRMLDEIHSGVMEGMTYKEIQQQFPEEYFHRKRDKLFYRYPGPGGESYLDIINRLRAVIVEVERTTDHVLLVSHRSTARVLLAYFRGLKRDEVANLDVPLGMVYILEPKPYGVDFKAYLYNPDTEWFDYQPDYELHQVNSHQL
ncbi:Bifunctional 6-phosphofructo-2-kinase/fructose-2 6-bisphosphate 2-phosphatase, partial [Penicillium chermesinum]